MFLLESGLLGVVGGAIGTVLGAGIAKLVQAIATAFIGPGLVQAQIPGWLVVSVLGFSFLAGAVSGVAPAYRASRLQPVEALREE
jgi:putative ABC transport system permease protein